MRAASMMAIMKNLRLVIPLLDADVGARRSPIYGWIELDELYPTIVHGRAVAGRRTGKRENERDLTLSDTKRQI